MNNERLKHRALQAIGMFDSGVGGLTVMQQIVYTLPKENIVYFGDTARLPYGEKSRETIIRYAIENTIFLMEQGIKILVIPCNTASSYAIEKLQQIFNIPILGVIDPGVKKVIQTTKNGRIGILGTRGTINSGIYQKKINESMPDIEVHAMACPLLAPLVEERFLEHPATSMIVKEYLAPLKNQKVDTILLACTHYPLIQHLIQNEMGQEVKIVDSATTCAESVVAALDDYQLHTSLEKQGTHKYFVSDDPEKFQKLGTAFLGMPIHPVETSHGH